MKVSDAVYQMAHQYPERGEGEIPKPEEEVSIANWTTW